MGRKIRVATTSLATFEDIAPPYNLRHPTPEENLALGLRLLEAAGEQEVDLVCLPESLTSAGMPYAASTVQAAAETLDGNAFTQIARMASRYRMNVVCGLPLLIGGRAFNTVVFVDRNGELGGLYAKMHPTEGEIGCGITPGAEAVVVEADFGRVGLAVCFDINWGELWASMAAQRADLVCWLSAYPGGFPLQAYAWQHQYRIVTSVWTYEARVIDLTGRILTQSTRWERLVTCELDLNKRLFHTDGQAQHLLALHTRYGRRIHIETYHEEHLFSLESLDPTLDIDDVCAEFDLVDYATYLARCTAAQQAARMPQLQGIAE